MLFSCSTWQIHFINSQTTSASNPLSVVHHRRHFTQQIILCSIFHECSLTSTPSSCGPEGFGLAFSSHWAWIISFFFHIEYHVFTLLRFIIAIFFLTASITKELKNRGMLGFHFSTDLSCYMIVSRSHLSCSHIRWSNFIFLIFCPSDYHNVGSCPIWSFQTIKSCYLC